MNEFRQERKKLVDRLKKLSYIKTKKVENAFLSVPRENFVQDKYRRYCYVDEPIPIGKGQTISAPHMHAIMTELLEIRENHKILEIGTGSGYQTAILSKIAKEVFSVERIRELADTAKNNLKRSGIKNVKIIHKDGFNGYPKKAPFDRIIVTACPTRIPENLGEQLKEGGKMVIPLGDNFQQDLFVFDKIKGELKGKKLFPVRFVPMVA